MIPIPKLPPFKRFCITIGALPATYIESLSYYETLLWLCKYLQNTVIPAINTNAEAVTELQTAFETLQSYVDSYFENLDVQEEINNKLDDMVEQGTLQDIITAYLQVSGVLAYDTVADMVAATNLINGSICRTLGKTTYNDGKGAFYKVRTITNNDTVDGINIIALDVSNTLIAELIQDTNEYYDILKHGGFDDGVTPNDSIFNTAKTMGYRKFYFSQNSSHNASYYFTNYPVFNDCEILADEDVIINNLNLSNIDSTKTGTYKSNIIYHSREQDTNFLVPSNVSDYFNHFNMKNYLRKINVWDMKDLSGLKMFIYNYTTTGLYDDISTMKEDYYQEIDYNIRFKANAYTSILCAPIDCTKYQCMEIEATPNTQIYFGTVDSGSNTGTFSEYDNVIPENTIPNQYYAVDGTVNPTITTSYTKFPNIWKHYLKNAKSNNYTKTIKYKLKNNPIHKQFELYVNDIFVCGYPWGATTIDYMGFGIKNITGTSSSNGFSFITMYEEEVTPLNTSLNILLIGDSRTYGYNTQYKIEDIIKCGLISNGVNNVNIDNISVSGYTMSNIITTLGNTDLNKYDIVVTCTGINDYLATYKSIVDATFQINQTITNSNCFSIMCSTIPACYDGTDPLGDGRAENYYKIENALLLGCSYNMRYGLVKYVPNVMGNTNYENLIPMCNDGVHPTALGTIQFAKVIVNEILNLYN